jgi:3-oxoacyl-[acyl-carrier-protein] synthase III
MEKMLVNIEKYGNTSSASIPLCLYDFKDSFKPGNNLLLTAFGSGYTWGAVWLTWGN